VSKLEFNWDGKELVIKQCDKIKTAPQSCNACKYRFQCFTERIKTNDARVSSAEVTKLSDILKDIQVKFDEPDGITNN